VEDPNQKAIEITVNDVTLDLNGHMIRGPHTGPPWGGSGNGIYADKRYNITIENGRIWGFGGDGVYLGWTSSTQSDWARTGHCIKDIQSANNGSDGINLSSGLVTNCTLNNNNSRGIFARFSTVTNCIANNNNNNGIQVYNSTVVNCSANYCGWNGIEATSSTITNCSASKNLENGIYTHISSITNCTVSANLGRGLEISASIVTNCSVINNNSHGIYAEFRNRIAENNISSNGINSGSGYGIYIYEVIPGGGGEKNYIIKNTLSDNISGPFRIPDGSDNYIPDCDVVTTDNCNYTW
jgi:hypothetical protein